MSESDRRAIRIALERQHGRAVPVTAEMIDAVQNALRDENTEDES